MTPSKRTPCVGICSTTYGDLVCRGCKRFAHEIVQWNGYDSDQQGRVWERLQGLRDSVVKQYVLVEDAESFATACRRVAVQTDDQAEAVYSLMRYLVADDATLASAGLVAMADADEPLAAMQAIDMEFYTRSVAHYERNFKTPL